MQIPPDVLVSSAPNLKNKGKLLEKMKQPNPAQQMQQQLALKGAAAEVKLTEAQTMKTVAEAQNLGAGEQQPQVDPNKLIDAQVRQAEGQVKLQTIAAKGRSDQVKAELDIEGKRLDNIGKTLDIQRQRETPPPQPSQAA